MITNPINNNNKLKYSYNKISTFLSNDNNTFIEYLKILYDNNKLFNPNNFIIGLGLFNNNILTDNYSNFITNYIVKTYKNYIDSYHIIDESFLYLNSTVLMGDVSNFYNYLVPYKCYNASPQKGLYSYSFALHPTETQPSGSINLSRIPSYILRVKVNDLIDVEKNLNYNTINNLDSNITANNQSINYKLIVHVTNFNVLRLIGGIGALAYTY